MTRLAARLEESRAEIEGYARQYGLDFYDTVFETVSPREMMVVAARDGFPSRYEHWRFGMEYRRMKTYFDLGQMRIYELVLNNNPSLAYMLNDNDDVVNKLVIGHVYAHVDFFKNNLHFRHTDRKMIDQMANHRRRIRQYSRGQGIDTVDDLVDSCLSLNNLIDFQAREPPFTTLPPERRKRHFKGDDEEETVQPPEPAQEAEGDEYMAWWLREMVPEHERAIAAEEPAKRPVRDVMLFLIEHAPLKDWEASVLSMMRDETYYFAPQRQTKIMNEGWATYWHSKIMRGEGVSLWEQEGRPSLDVPLLPPYLDFKDTDLYARVNAGVLATSPSQLNPYKLGVELYKDIEERWNLGLFGREYEECEEMERKLGWDTGLNEGRDYIYFVRELYNDWGFLNRFLTKDFCRKQKMFIYDYNPMSGWYEISDRDWLMVKERLLNQFTNAGEPVIEITDDNYKNRRELYLRHEHPGPEEFDLKLDHALDTLIALQKLWRRPVHIETLVRGQKMRFSHDGTKPWMEELEPRKRNERRLPDWL